MSECTVCTDPYTSVVRTKITCNYCNYSACKPCISRYLLSQVVDAHCMNCRTGWNREFMDSNMTKSFRTGLWREHQKKMMVNREKALLPNFQRYAAAKKKMNEIELILNKEKMEEHTLHVKKIILDTNINNINNYMVLDNLKDDIYTKQLLDYLDTYKDIMFNYTLQKIKVSRLVKDFSHYSLVYKGTAKKDVEKREFIMKCVKEDCRGFLSQAYKCEICNTYVCNDCMVIKKEKNDEEHVCKKEDVETVSMIRKDTHPCPKCGIRISKIDGCDMMWCTSEGCGTAFSWNTGKILSGTIHNPHYYEWLRRNNKGDIPRNPGDVPCGGLPNAYTMTRNLQSLQLYGYTGANRINTVQLMYNTKATTLMNAHRCLTDIQQYRIPQYNTQRRDDLLKDIHVDYLIGDMNETEWKNKIFIRENALEKKHMIAQVLNTFLNAGSDIIRNAETVIQTLVNLRKNGSYVLNETDMKPFLDIITQLEVLQDYINETFINLSKNASMAVPLFKNWNWLPLATYERIMKEKEKEVKRLEEVSKKKLLIT